MNWLRKFSRLGLGTTIFLLIGASPLFFFPSAYDPFILPKIAFIKVLVIFLTLFSFINWLFLKQGLKIRLNIFNAALLFFVLLNALSLIYATSKSLSIETISFTVYLLLFAILLQDYLLGKRRQIVVAGWIFLFSGVLTAIWVLMQDFFPQLFGIVPKLPDWRGFLSAGLGNTNHIGDFLALTLVLALLLFLFIRRKWREILLLLSIILISSALLVCWSVGSTLGLIVALIVVALCLYQQQNSRFWLQRWKRLFAIFISAIIILVFYFTPQPLNPHRPSLLTVAFSSPRWHAGAPTRLAIWLNTLEIIRQHRLLGVGAGNFTYFYPQVISPLILASPSLAHYAGLYTNAAHNELLQTWAELGILGFATLIFLIAAFFWQLLKEIRYSTQINFLIQLGLLGLMTAFVVQAQMNLLLQLPSFRLLFFALLVLPGAMLNKNRFGRGELIQVEFERRFFSLSLWLHQMRTPQVLEIKSKIKNQNTKIALTAMMLFFCGWLTVSAVKPLVSDVLYKQAHNLLMINEPAIAEQYFQRALAVWEDHSDCRSAYSTFLLTQGRYKEVITQINKVHERLKSSETYYRLGLAYYHLKEYNKAAQNWQIFFSRLTRAISEHPQEYDWLRKYWEHEKKN